MRCSMPRRARIAPGEIIYHALNRANGRGQLFDKPEDYAAFERIMVAAMRRSPIRLPILGVRQTGASSKCCLINCP